MLCFLCHAEGSAADRTKGSAAFHEKHPPLAAGESLQHDRNRLSARRMPWNRTETSFQSKAGVLLEKPGWALQGVSVETDPKPSTMRQRQKPPCPSRGKAPGSQTFVSALNRVALSDTFIIAFNSPKSVYALEERTRT